jgi:1,4-dihydroxy-2-naphthoyl-CoA hydrolase
VDAQPALSPQPGGFEDLLGLEVVEIGDESARGRLGVREQLTEAGGQVHGGVFAAVAQDLVTRATARALGAEGREAVALSNQTSYLRPILAGEIRAQARRRHRGRSTWVWEVDMTDDQDQLCAFSRVTVALRA